MISAASGGVTDPITIARRESRGGLQGASAVVRHVIWGKKPGELPGFFLLAT